MGADAFSDLGDFSPLEIGLGLLLLFALVYSSRAAILLWRLGLENRRLRRGLRGYAEMERHHAEVTRENRERNDFQERLPVLISALHAERTVEGICRRIVEFTARVLGASEASLYLREGSSLVLREARAAVAPTPRIPLGQGRIGVVGQLRRILAAEDFAGLDPTTRASAAAGPSRPDTQIAAPLLAHGELLGVLNVGGTVSASAALRKEILSVIAQLGPQPSKISSISSGSSERPRPTASRACRTSETSGRSSQRSYRERLASGVLARSSCSISITSNTTTIETATQPATTASNSLPRSCAPTVEPRTFPPATEARNSSSFCPKPIGPEPSPLPRRSEPPSRRPNIPIARANPSDLSASRAGSRRFPTTERTPKA